MRRAALFATAFGLLASAQAVETEFSYRHALTAGETRRYELDRRVYRDGSQIYQALAVSSHTVTLGPPPRELVRFERLVKYAGREPADLAAAAAAFPGLEVPLSTEAAREMPAWPGADASLAALARDLRLVLLVSHSADTLGRLRRPGDSYAEPAPRREAWAADSVALSESCWSVETRLSALAASKVTVFATLAPPEAACLEPRSPWMKAVDDAPPPNMQQVSLSGASRRASWGAERVTISVTLDRATGELLSADLDAVREGGERDRCDAALEHCSPPTTSTLRRTLRLRAL